MAVMSGLSGNEMYCLHLKGFRPGDLVIGNSVFSLGFMGNLSALGRTLAGGEVNQITEVIHEGRLEAYQRMVKEAEQRGGVGITGVTNDLSQMMGHTEFLSVASCVHREDERPEQLEFSTSADAQELYCQMDAGYMPKRFVFGNIAYSIGVGGGVTGALRGLSRGEIPEFSQTFNKTRHICLARIRAEAAQVGANAVVGIKTYVMPFGGVHEMLMIGTAARNDQLPSEHNHEPVTSDLTCEEMWNLTHMGYMPLKLLMGTAVYSLGVVGGITSAFKSFQRGEISELTTLIYDAREHAIGLIKREADAIGADDVVGIRTVVHEMGSIVEFMAIGTAIKRHEGVQTATAQIPPQAVIRDKDTWFSPEDMGNALGKSE